MPFVFSPLPHAAAVARIAGLPLVSRDVMDGLLPELRAYAFTISGLDVGDTMSRIRDTIKAVPAGALNWDKARKEIAADLDDALGGKVAQRRAELLLRTHVFRSYAAARYRNLIAQIDVFPFWQYKTVGDERVRPSHVALNGKIFPAGHEIWQRIFPPWDWGCRCLVVPLTQGAAERVLKRGKLPDGDAAAALLLPTQNARPEIFSGKEASLIAKNARLPNGIPLNRTPTWADSPWSAPGNVQHDWKLIRKRYAGDPEALKTFEAWAKATEISPGLTVDRWLKKGLLPLAKKATKKAAIKVAPAVIKKALKGRVMADVMAEMKTIELEHAAAALEVEKTRAAYASAAVLDPGFNKIRDAHAAAKGRLASAVEHGREVCSVPPAERGDVVIGLKGKVQAQNINEGRAIVNRYTHAELLPKGISTVVINGRAFQDGDTINVMLGEDASTIAHEITHATERQNPAVLQASRDFLRSRFGPKDKFFYFKKRYPTWSYKEWEFSFDDEWKTRGGIEYSGKVYHTGVGSKDMRKLWQATALTDPAAAYQHIYATELLTVGIERLHKDPVDFFRQDPAYFRFTVQTLQKLP